MIQMKEQKDQETERRLRQEKEKMDRLRQEVAQQKDENFKNKLGLY
jgi:ribosome-interacting GTPase 1